MLSERTNVTSKTKVQRAARFQNHIHSWVHPNCPEAVNGNYNSILGTNKCSEHIYRSLKTKTTIHYTDMKRKRRLDEACKQEELSAVQQQSMNRK
jgi:quinolinate synthase